MSEPMATPPWWQVGLGALILLGPFYLAGSMMLAANVDIEGTRAAELVVLITTAIAQVAVGVVAVKALNSDRSGRRADRLIPILEAALRDLSDFEWHSRVDAHTQLTLMHALRQALDHGDLRSEWVSWINAYADENLRLERAARDSVHSLELRDQRSARVARLAYGMSGIRPSSPIASLIHVARWTPTAELPELIDGTMTLLEPAPEMDDTVRAAMALLRETLSDLIGR